MVEYVVHQTGPVHRHISDIVPVKAEYRCAAVSGDLLNKMGDHLIGRRFENMQNSAVHLQGYDGVEYPQHRRHFLDGDMPESISPGAHRIINETGRFAIREAIDGGLRNRLGVGLIAVDKKHLNILEKALKSPENTRQFLDLPGALDDKSDFPTFDHGNPPVTNRYSGRY